MHSLLLILGLLLASPDAGVQLQSSPALLNASVDVCFTPGERCDLKLIALLDTVTKGGSIHVQEYEFTLQSVADALVRAAKRRIDVQVILDARASKDPYSDKIHSILTGGGVITLVDSSHKIAHNKIMIINGKTIVGGSYNISKGAQSFNAENMIFVTNIALAVKYESNFQLHLIHSK